MPTLARFIRTTFSNDTGSQLALFRAVEEGNKQRGGSLSPAMRDWGTDLAEQLLNSVDPGSLTWHNFPVKSAETTNPWFLQKRTSADGDTTATFVCSLPPGGESLTGSLRSRPFAIPRKLDFYIAGHDGPPSNPPQNKNMVRLRDAMTDQVLAESAPPRNDVAQPFTWDLSKQAGKQGYLEIVDGNTGDAYAWLAVGRIEPPVVRLPEISPSEVGAWQLAAAELARTLGVKRLTPRLAILLNDERADADARSAAAQALIMLEPAGQEVAFSRIISRADEPMGLRAKVADILGTMNAPRGREILLQALQTAPGGLQKEVALALASNVEGAEALLQAVADGKASARLLQERKIRERLIAAKPANCVKLIETLTANLPAADEERQKLIGARRTLFNSSEPSVAQGAQAFKTYCAICHSLDGQGALIGPQLDGVSARGADRLIEDILDPNRNVDRAFRTTILVVKDGDVQSGLFRREEGEIFVLAQSNGKEISVPKKDVKERRESETSLMPDNF